MRFFLAVVHVMLCISACAAMQHYGVKPDLLIAACGGSIAANIINSFATDEQRKAFIQSEELYRFVQNTRMTRFKMLYKIGVYCQRKVRNTFYAPYIENIFEDQIPQEVMKERYARFCPRWQFDQPFPPS